VPQPVYSYDGRAGKLNCLHVKASETQACSNFASWNIVERHSTMVPLCFLKMALLMEHGGSSLAAFTTMSALPSNDET